MKSTKTTKNLFDRAAVFTDIHLGLRNNSRQHNEDCKNFIQWFIETAKEENCETCIFTGDWHHSRNSINVSTLNYTVECIHMLSKAFDTVYMLMGNHDLYYREKRDLHSVPWIDLHDNVVVINDKIFEKGNVTIIPWLIGNEWKKLKNVSTKYVFGHFELPHFKMNAMVTMPDHGGLKAQDMKKPDYVFSGHFHKRQIRDNIIYIGNCFPHNYADVDDDERGAMFLEWDQEPRFASWPDAPRYRKVNLSVLLQDPDAYLDHRTYCQIKTDLTLNYDEMNFIKETFMKKYKCRELVLKPSRVDEHAEDNDTPLSNEIKDVDTIVMSQLKTINSKVIDNNILLRLYQEL